MFAALTANTLSKVFDAAFNGLLASWALWLSILSHSHQLAPVFY